MKPGMLVITALSALGISAPARSDFALGFSDCPTEVTGAPGEVKTIHLFATLTSANLPAIPVDNPPAGCPAENHIGSQGWSFGIQIDGADHAALALDTVTISTLFDHDAQCQTAPVEEPFTLSDAGFLVADSSDTARDPADPKLKGITEAVVLSIKKQTRYLHPEGTEKIGDLALTFTIPALGVTRQVQLQYRNGLVGSGEPVPNIVTLAGKSYSMARGEVSVEGCSFNIRAVAPHLLRRGDVDGSGSIEITDAIGILGHLFLGDNSAWICAEAGDTDNDGTVDVSDVVNNLTYQFLGGAPPESPGPITCGPDPGNAFLGCDADCK